jgi:hypothetical protein
MLIALRGLPASEVDALIVNECNGDLSPRGEQPQFLGVGFLIACSQADTNES